MPVSLPRLQQSQVAAAVNRSRAQAIKVTTAEAITANDIIVATSCSATGLMTVSKADADSLTLCRGPFFIADYTAASGVTTDLAIPWKVITGVDTSAASQVGDPVWLSTTAGAYVVSVIPAATATSNDFALAVKIGRVLVVGGTGVGVVMLEPGMANGAPLVGRVTLDTSGSTTVDGFTAELDGSPVVVNSGNAGSIDASDCNAAIASGTLTIRSTTGITTVATYMIHS
jgi:hypothetical protein